MSKENENLNESENSALNIADVRHSASRAKAIEWFKSLPFVKARSLAINETGRFIREPF